MSAERLCIVQVNTYDHCGGAERVAHNLFEALAARGQESWLAVGRRRRSHPRVRVIPNHRTLNPWAAFWWCVHRWLQPWYHRYPLCRRAGQWSHRLASPGSWLDDWRGREVFRFPGTWQIPRLAGRRPDVVHAHNLHGRYFDLRALPALSASTCLVLTLHDMWPLTGHCAHSVACERWLTGCGRCPDLAAYPALRRDGTAGNWRRKQDIYAQCRLHVATPSRWLMEQVRRSMLAPAVVSSRVIPNGVDVEVFHPGAQAAARRRLGLPGSHAVLLFSGYRARRNGWKDYQTLRSAVRAVAERRLGRPVLFVVLGEGGEPEPLADGQIRFVPFVDDSRMVADYYRAADLYVHAARADTFPNTVLEALACGTPVVATAVGGIPEQVRSLPAEERADAAVTATGLLTPPGDPVAMAAGIGRLLSDEPLRRRLGDDAAADARRRFALDRQVEAYLDWYRELCGRSGRPTPAVMPAASRLPPVRVESAAGRSRSR